MGRRLCVVFLLPNSVLLFQQDLGEYFLSAKDCADSIIDIFANAVMVCDSSLRSELMTRQLSVALILLLFLCPMANAGLVSFSNISQSGQGPGDPLFPYGPHTILGNTLVFDSPAGFAATSANGIFDIEDSFTDGLLSFSVDADPDTWITGLKITERGARTLFELIVGSGSANTRVQVIALADITITELDHGNTPLTPAAAAPISIGFDLTWDLINDPGAVLWTGMDARDIEQILINRGVEFEQGATALNFIMNNQLFAISEEGTFAFIDKKRIEIEVRTEMIPEPTTAVLAMFGLLGVSFGRGLESERV